MAEEKKVKIALVEDEKFLLGAMRDKLEREGFDVYTATNGEIGLEIIKKEKPALILLDLIMPIKSGFDVLEELQKDGELKKIPVIILSNLGQELDVKKGKELGATDYLIKADFKMKEVIAKVREHLK
ncbi:response regulator [Patescibacteria group bacterium]|nr:response regulator [Patescibacteria group bacterium]